MLPSPGMSTNVFSTRALRAPSPRSAGLLRSPWTSLQLAGLAVATALVAAFTLPPELVHAVAAEHGPVETLQALLLFALAAGIFLYRPGGEAFRTAGSVAFLLFAMGARELEWHKPRVGGNVLKPGFYLGPAAPGTKLVAAALVLLLAISAIDLLRRHGRDAWSGLRRREPLSITAATFFVVLASSRIADKIHSGDNLNSLVAGTVIVEETLELALPLLVLLGVLQHRAARAELPRRAAGLSPSPLLPGRIAVRAD